MTRHSQLERLASLLEKREGWKVARYSNRHGRAAWEFVHKQLWLTTMWLEPEPSEISADTADSLPCLAILRKVKGNEDWDIHVHVDKDGVKRWEPHPLDLDEQEARLLDAKAVVSTVSRVDSLCLLLEVEQ